MKKFLAILAGKIIFYATRLLKIGGGSAAPGLYALKIYPKLVGELAKQIPKNVVITGTNGKTTTARMLAHFAKGEGLKVIRNHTGSNLERGIASALIHHSSFIINHSSYDLGIWELDEAAFNATAPKIKPDIIVFLNVFRDQLDRYGEVDTVVRRWCGTLKNIGSEAQVYINGDDENLIKLLKCYKGKTQKFGLSDYKIPGEHGRIISQKLDLEARNIKAKGLLGSSFQLSINHEPITINLPLPGIYHIYDFLAAFGLGLNLGLDPVKMVDSLKDYSPAFGRVEKFSFPPGGWEAKRMEGYIFLIKNPAGATEVFKTIAPQMRNNDRLLIALNDNLADGTDVSWIWDADFEQFTIYNPPVGGQFTIICSGTRAQDLAVRLKYANFYSENIKVENNIGHAFDKAKEGLKGRLFILPTYTALLDLQKILEKQKIKNHYWQE